MLFKLFIEKCDNVSVAYNNNKRSPGYSDEFMKQNKRQGDAYYKKKSVKADFEFP